MSEEGSMFEVEVHQVLGAYDAITRWATAHGRTLECSPSEVYLSEDDEPLRMQIVWPLG